MARIQKIESDSSFVNSNILPGTIMTWKSLEGDRIKYMAKKPDGSVVEITPKVDFSTSFSLSNYYTKDEVDGFIGRLSNSLSALKEDLHSSYYTKLQTYNKEQVNALIAGISTSFSLSDYYTKEEIDQKLSDSYYTKEQLYTKDETYNKQQVDALVAGLSNSFSLSNYYTKQQVDALIEELSNSIEAVNQKFDSYYTKQETDQKLSDSYYNKSQMEALLVQKYDLSDAQTLQEDVQDLQWTALQKITFSSISQGVYTIDRPVAVIGIYNNNGRYFPIQKGSVEYSNSSTIISLAPYLAYSNMSTFTGTWKLLIANTGNRE